MIVCNDERLPVHAPDGNAHVSPTGYRQFGSFQCAANVGESEVKETTNDNYCT